MKMTVITQQGNVVAVVYGHTPQPSPDEYPGAEPGMIRAGLMAGPGQKLHVIEASEQILRINNPKELIAEVAAQLKKAK
ncbi:MAG: hypothetical protein ACRD96_13400 [Bryobacteraceae bacterium]